MLLYLHIVNNKKSASRIQKHLGKIILCLKIRPAALLAWSQTNMSAHTRITDSLTVCGPLSDIHSQLYDVGIWSCPPDSNSHRKKKTKQKKKTENKVFPAKCVMDVSVSFRVTAIITHLLHAVQILSLTQTISRSWLRLLCMISVCVIAYDEAHVSNGFIHCHYFEHITGTGTKSHLRATES